MNRKSLFFAAFAAFAAALAVTPAASHAQATFKQLPVTNPNYVKPFPPVVWVSSHAGHFNMHDKYKPGDAYDPNRFVDPAGYLQKIELYEQRYREQLAKDQKAN